MDDKVRKAQRRWASEGTEDARVSLLQELQRTGYIRFFECNQENSLFEFGLSLGLENMRFPLFKHELVPNAFFTPFEDAQDVVWVGIEWEWDYYKGYHSSNIGRTNRPVGFWVFPNIDGFSSTKNKTSVVFGARGSGNW